MKYDRIRDEEWRKPEEEMRGDNDDSV